MKTHPLLVVVLALGVAVGCSTKTPKSARDDVAWDGPYIGAMPNPSYVGDPWGPPDDEPMMDDEPVTEDRPADAMTETVPDEAVEAPAAEPMPEAASPGVSEVAAEELPMPTIETATGEQAEPDEVAAMEDAVDAADDAAEAAIDDLQDAAQAMDEAAAEVEAAAVVIPEDMVPIDSTAMDAVKYDDLMEVLTIQFDNGRTYEYLDVPPEVYEAFLDAPSKGSYFRRTIEDSFESIQR